MIRKRITRDRLPLNAIGRYGEDDEWQPFHLRDDGINTDQCGVEIMRFHEVLRKSPTEIAVWMKAQNLIPINLDLGTITIVGAKL